MPLNNEFVEIKCSQCGRTIMSMNYQGFMTAICIYCEQGDGFQLPEEITPKQWRSFGVTQEDLLKRAKKKDKSTEQTQTPPEKVIPNIWKKNK